MLSKIRAMSRTLLLIRKHPCHAGMHVIQQMAMEQPVALFISFKLDRPFSHRRHIDRVLERRVISLTLNHPEKMAMQVQRVMHH